MPHKLPHLHHVTATFFFLRFKKKLKKKKKTQREPPLSKMGVAWSSLKAKPTIFFFSSLALGGSRTTHVALAGGSATPKPAYLGWPNPS
jgi:hypothetical protein